MSLEGAIAAHRFGLGARPGEIARASANPKTWLTAQLDGPAPMPRDENGQPFPNAGKLVSEEEDYKALKFRTKGDKAARKAANRQKVKMGGMGGNIRRQEYVAEMASRLALGCTTDRPFHERLVRFWSNHFTVSGARHKVMLFAGAFEREAIRPHVTGNFEDMLFAVCMHPAMQVYLDNWHSIGPNSRAAKGGKGLNENLGRELMELYTLGVDGGYTQADVIAMAKLLTGWGLYDGRPDGFGFYDTRHEPGPITLRGKTYPAGWDGGVAAIKDLAHDPATARHVARKLATHFIADDPPKDSVARLEAAFKDSKGNLRVVSEAIVNDPNAWKPEQRKMRTPVEYLTAAMRLTGSKGDHREMRRLLGSARMMGEIPFGAPSPKGWPDTADAWSGSDGLLDRIQWAKEFGDGLPSDVSIANLANDGLGPLLKPNTKSVMAKAGSRGEAVALLLASPEFQRR
ncbi:MAG TPA: DUF1800 domain-containing protein [Rhizomicrobium sp.]|nr:DUF1800 domain-containing protein [Rhizomicrobium sp.]